mmetsp:Transcript_30753/g.43047  ORF Transcript_30753/g.43047 Transcript_30753/m.43047 type:complete len:583 (-) Transcript_30753:157-1905(-)
MGCGLPSRIEIINDLEKGSDDAVAENPRFVTAFQAVEWGAKESKCVNVMLVDIQFKYLSGKNWTATIDTPDHDELTRSKSDRTHMTTFGAGEYIKEVTVSKYEEDLFGIVRMLELTTNIRKVCFGDATLDTKDGKKFCVTYTADSGKMVTGLKFDEAQEKVIGIQASPISEYVKQSKYERPEKDKNFDGLDRDYAVHLRCHKGHRLIFTTYSRGGYEGGSCFCDECKEEIKCIYGRWWCNLCRYDACRGCRSPEEKEKERNHYDKTTFCPKGCKMEYTDAGEEPWSCDGCGANERNTGYIGWRFHCKKHNLDYCGRCRPAENKPADVTCAECGHKCVYQEEVHDGVYADPLKCAVCKNENERGGGYACEFLWQDKMCGMMYCFDCIPDAKSCPEPAKHTIRKGFDSDRHKAIIDPAEKKGTNTVNILSIHGGALRVLKDDQIRSLDFNGGLGKDAMWKVTCSSQGHIKLRNLTAEGYFGYTIKKAKDKEKYTKKMNFGPLGSGINFFETSDRRSWNVVVPPCGQDCFQLVMDCTDVNMALICERLRVFLACDSNGKMYTKKIKSAHPKRMYDMNTLFRFASL